MTCGCGKQRTQNVGLLWAQVDALDRLRAEALEENERLREAVEILLRERGEVGADEPVWVLDPAFDIARAVLQETPKQK